MPVSPLSEAMLCLLTGVLRWLDGAAVVVHRDSLPGNHAGEQSRPGAGPRGSPAGGRPHIAAQAALVRARLRPPRRGSAASGGRRAGDGRGTAGGHGWRRQAAAAPAPRWGDTGRDGG